MEQGLKSRQGPETKKIRGYNLVGKNMQIALMYLQIYE